MRLLRSTVVVFLLIFCCSAFAQDCRVIETKGVREDEFVCGGPLLLGTTKGLYKKDAKADLWQRVNLTPAPGRINQILFKSDKEAYVAAQKGSYRVNLVTDEATRIFTRSNEMERDCVSVALAGQAGIWLGTRSGLFFNGNKIGTPFDNKEVVSVVSIGDTIYAATVSKIYRSQDEGTTWQEIFNLYPASEELQDEETNESKIRHLAGVDGSPHILYVATAGGIYITQDSGKIWQKLPVQGLDAVGLRYISIDSASGDVYAVAQTGLYLFHAQEWTLVTSTYEGRQVVQKGEKLYLVTKKELLECSKNEALVKEAGGNSRQTAEVFKNEPVVQQVQKMAIDYAEVGNQKIKDWRRKAAVKAMLPKLSFGYNSNVYGSYNGAFAVGPNDWDVSVSWDLADLVYNEAQTSIDTRSKLMVELRNDILSEVTRLYFERRKLQIEVYAAKDMSEKAAMDKNLRIMELTALLDRLTGGAFSKDLKSSF